MKHLNAIHVGISGFPFGYASTYRCLAIYEILRKENIEILIINNWSTYPPDIPVKIAKKGYYNNIRYVYTTPSPYKPRNPFIRKWYKIAGRVNEFFLLLKLSFGKKIDLMFFYPNGNFFELLYYRSFSKIFGFFLISHYVEYRSGFTKRKKNKWLKLNDHLFDNYFMKFVDGIIIISQFLINHVLSHHYNKPYIKIPPVSDYNAYHFTKSVTGVDYFLYAGGFYKETIILILEAFRMVNKGNYYLYLILNDFPRYRSTYLKMIENHPKKNKIKMFSQLKYSDLLNKYYNAKALLIPLNNSLKDIARFPQKITEYLASGSPIITTNFGEIKYYFKDNTNAYIADRFTPEALAEKMNKITSDPEKARKIGENGKKTGLRFFNSNEYRKPLMEFIHSIMN